MKDNKEIEQNGNSKKEIKEEVRKTVGPSKEETDATTKELEALRKFKTEIEAKQKAEKEKPDTVDVSGTFFSKRENYTQQPQTQTVSSEVKEMLDLGVAFHQE
jgi:hypothetical protein